MLDDLSLNVEHTGHALRARRPKLAHTGASDADLSHPPAPVLGLVRTAHRSRDSSAWTTGEARVLGCPAGPCEAVRRAAYFFGVRGDFLRQSVRLAGARLVGGDPGVLGFREMA